MEGLRNLVALFEAHLMETGFARATIESYVGDVRLFYRHLKRDETSAEFTRAEVLNYKRQMMDKRQAIATVTVGDIADPLVTTLVD